MDLPSLSSIGAYLVIAVVAFMIVKALAMKIIIKVIIFAAIIIGFLSIFQAMGINVWQLIPK